MIIDGAHMVIKYFFNSRSILFSFFFLILKYIKLPKLVIIDTGRSNDKISIML